MYAGFDVEDIVCFIEKRCCVSIRPRRVGCKKDAISIKTVAFQNFPEGININRKHDCQFKRTPSVSGKIYIREKISLHTGENLPAYARN
jgi:hypothetical protein